MKRRRIPRKKSKKMFSRTADLSHRLNFVSSNPMRGGIRM